MVGVPRPAGAHRLSKLHALPALGDCRHVTVAAMTRREDVIYGSVYLLVRRTCLGSTVAESDFFMTRDDSLAFVSFLIDLVCAEFVPERSAVPPPLCHLRTLAQVDEQMDRDARENRCSRFFVLSRLWERFPLVADEIHANDGQHFFAVAQRYGGPAFDFVPARTYREGHTRWIVPGSFSDHSHYIKDKAFLADQSLYCAFPRPEEMTSAHQAVRKYLKKGGCRSISLETGRPGPWLRPGAVREFNAGVWLRVGEQHFEPKI
jgi:hypothetical protein